MLGIVSCTVPDVIAVPIAETITGIYSQGLYTKEQNAVLLPYVGEFVEILAKNGITLEDSDIYPIHIGFADLGGSISAQTWEAGEDGIYVLVDYDWFQRRGERTWDLYPQFVMYHEFAHAMFGLKHKHDVRIMKTGTPETQEELEQIVVDAYNNRKD